MVNNNCVMCPFHGWTYDGETGQCVGNLCCILDNDGKAVKLRSIEYV